ncbi:Fcf2-domain-containing protein [Auriscalpium vulgare]|uniref:Fcf2-domain-containing protein n=1 Tax=Auriscalpium vulgare TaxID=40419 RepID=A0ACB8RFW1_9AGAM|nr:Fcf2-domain-containing protein [Auriscalpium vulgare]
MALTALDKGKGKAMPEDREHEQSSSSSSSGSEPNSSSESDSDSSDDSASDSEEDITPEYLESLLDKARQNAAGSASTSNPPARSGFLSLEEDIIDLGGADRQLPALDPGTLPKSYITLGATRRDGPSQVRDLGAEQAVQSASNLLAPAPPPAPPALTKSGVPLTKKERKAMKNLTAGPSWFDLPAPDPAELPRLYREVEALRLRNQLDPKRFYRKDEGEGRGIKGLPKYFAIGKVVTTSTPFGGPSTDNLPRAARKRTLVDELVDDAEARRYAKRKFGDLQGTRAKKGRGTLAAKKAARAPKW